AASDGAAFTTSGDGADMAGPALAIRDVTVRYGGLAAVEGLSLDLTRGEILALIGPNGAGKSTAFNVITGFQLPDAGRVRFVGLEHKAEEAAKNLSCGEQRLLGLAIALAPDPSVLLLDEPAAGLNAVETERLMRLIEGIRGRGLSVLLVEHDMKLVMGLCDR